MVFVERVLPVQSFVIMSLVQAKGIQPIDGTAFTDRVTAPGFADMFQKFVKGVDQKKRFQRKKLRI